MLSRSGRSPFIPQILHSFEDSAVCKALTQTKWYNSTKITLLSQRRLPESGNKQAFQCTFITATCISFLFSSSLYNDDINYFSCLSFPTRTTNHLGAVLTRAWLSQARDMRERPLALQALIWQMERQRLTLQSGQCPSVLGWALQGSSHSQWELETKACEIYGEDQTTFSWRTQQGLSTCGPWLLLRSLRTGQWVMDLN